MTKALDIIKQHGIESMGRFDGCACLDFKIGGVEVDVHCWRTSRDACQCESIGVHVSSTYDDYDAEDLRAIAVEVATQLDTFWPQSPKTLVVTPSSLLR